MNTWNNKWQRIKRFTQRPDYGVLPGQFIALTISIRNSMGNDALWMKQTMKLAIINHEK